MGQPPSFTPADDATLRVVGSMHLCLRAGLDRPELGAELRIEVCSEASPSYEPETEPVLHPAPRPSTTNHAAGIDLGKLEIIQMLRSLETKLDAEARAKSERLERLESQVAVLQCAQNSTNPSCSSPPSEYSAFSLEL